jgi:hypothetical protein
LYPTFKKIFAPSRSSTVTSQGTAMNIKFNTHLKPFQNENTSVDYLHDYYKSGVSSSISSTTYSISFSASGAYFSKNYFP